MIIRLQHLRLVPNCSGKNGYCWKGTKIFFERHGMDWKKFCLDGLDEKEFIKTGDAMALKLVETARLHG